MSSIFPIPTEALLLLGVGFLVGFYWMLGRHWLAARRTGQTLRFPLISWMLDCMRADLRRLATRVAETQARVDNNCGISASEQHPPVVKRPAAVKQPFPIVKFPLVKHLSVTKLRPQRQHPYDPSIN